MKPERIYVNLKESKWSVLKKSEEDIEYVVNNGNSYSEFEDKILKETDLMKRIYMIVIITTCKYFNITVDDFISKSSKSIYAYPRKFSFRIMYDLKEKYCQKIIIKDFAAMLNMVHSNLSTMARFLAGEISCNKEIKNNYDLLYEGIVRTLQSLNTPIFEKEKKCKKKSKKIQKEKCQWCYEKSMEGTRCTTCGYDTVKKMQIM